MPITPHTFYGTRGNRNGKIMIVGESWGKTEAFRRQPFVGETGKELERILFEAKIPISECFFTNVVSEQPQANEMTNFFHPTGFARKNNCREIRHLYPQENVIQGLELLRQQVQAIKPKVIVGLGNYASWALTENSFDVGDINSRKAATGIGRWRGSQLYTSKEYGGIPYLPTYHPAAVFRTHAWRYMIVHDLRARVPMALNDDWKEPEYEFIIQPSFKRATEFLLHILSLLDKRETEIVADVEASITRKLLSCVGLSYRDGEAMCIPLLCSYRETGYWAEYEEFEIVKLLRRIFTHPNCQLIGHNFLFDIQYFIDQLFMKPRIHFDTMLAQHTLWPGGGDPNDPNSAKNIAQGIQRKALYNCASLYCHHYYFWKDEGKDFGDNTGRDELQGWAYNCRDVVKTREVYHAQKALLNAFQLEEQFQTQMDVANKVALPMMVRGIRVNQQVKSKVNNDLIAALTRFDEQLLNLMPEEVRLAVQPKTSKKDPKTGLKIHTPWYTSPTQQKVIFYDILGIKPILGKSKTKQGEVKRPTLNKEALPIIAQREPILVNVVEKLETRRSVGVFQSTFGEVQEEPDGRLRCSYNPAGTDTFRFSSSENIYGRGGNFQNIPSGKEKSLFHFPNMRQHVEPDVGYELAEFDQSGADATIVAWEANDEELKNAFRKGMKIHLVNARAMYPDETRDMTDKEIKNGGGIPGSIYDTIKKCVHATNYGAAAETIANKHKMTIVKAQEFQERWFYLHPGIRAWHLRTDRWLNGLQCWRCDKHNPKMEAICPNCNAPTGRAIRNKFGYRIVYHGFMNELKKQALAWLPQSSVAINTNKAAIALANNVPHCELLLQVHDSLVVQYPIRFSTSILPDIKRALHSISVPYANDPLTIQWGCKASRTSWGSCEEVKDW